MDDALIPRRKVKEGDSTLGTILAQFLHHRVGKGIGEGFGTLVSRHDVIDGREGAVRIENFQSKFTYHAEGLGTGDLVDEVGADQKLSPTVGERANGVFLPDFIKKRFAHSQPRLA